MLSGDCKATRKMLQFDVHRHKLSILVELSVCFN